MSAFLPTGYQQVRVRPSGVEPDACWLGGDPLSPVTRWSCIGTCCSTGTVSNWFHTQGVVVHMQQHNSLCPVLYPTVTKWIKHGGQAYIKGEGEEPQRPWYVDQFAYSCSSQWELKRRYHFLEKKHWFENRRWHNKPIEYGEDYYRFYY